MIPKQDIGIFCFLSLDYKVSFSIRYSGMQNTFHVPQSTGRIIPSQAENKIQETILLENKIKQGMNDCIFIGICEPFSLYIHNVIPDAPSAH